MLGLRRTEGGSDPLTLSVERRARMLERLAADIEAGDPYTHGHSRRVARYAAMIATRLGASGADVARIRTAAAIHDVGKLDTPIEILHKPGRLTEAEFEIVKRHPATALLSQA
jgi:HD-GYP domain-containing protein (c-di-GMP phosphodiesterase class II)